MKLSRVPVFVAAVLLPTAPLVCAQSSPAAPSPNQQTGALSTPAEPPLVSLPPFEIEIQPAAERGPTFTARNMSDKTVTACVFEFSHSDTGRPEGAMTWDASVQRKPALEPGATLTLFLGHAVGQPLPDKVELVAGAFTDGDVFGQAKWVKSLLQGRAMFLNDYEQAAAYLQKGLDERWTYEQYLGSLDQLPKQGASDAIRRTLEANTNAQKHAEVLQDLIESMVDQFNRYAKKIRQAQAPANPPASESAK
jgi:hypothetical protein